MGFKENGAKRESTTHGLCEGTHKYRCLITLPPSKQANKQASKHSMMANGLGALIRHGSGHVVSCVQIVILSFIFLDDLYQHFLFENPVKMTLFLYFQTVAVVHHYHPSGGTIVMLIILHG